MTKTVSIVREDLINISQGIDAMLEEATMNQKVRAYLEKVNETLYEMSHQGDRSPEDQASYDAMKSWYN